jgi:steroid delta-isomerase-like uncharacterized protein
VSLGSVISIHIAPAAGAPMQSLETVRAVPAQGFEGDRYFTKQGTFSATPGSVRDVTLIEAESIEALNSKLGSTFAPADMRRNLVTRGVALNHLVGRDFKVGEVLLRGERLCQPCSYLETLTQVGVKATLQHRAGLRAEILEGGMIRVGDPLAALDDPLAALDDPLAALDDPLAALDDPLEQNKLLIRRFFDEMWNPWNFAKADELLAPEIKFRGTLGAELKGRDAFRAYMRQVQAAFPDFHNRILEMTSENDRVVARTIYRATHRGEIFGLAPTGKSISYAGAAFFKIADGKIVEGWVLGDLLGLLRQLDAHSLP